MVQIELLAQVRAVADIEFGLDIRSGWRDEAGIKRASDRKNIRIELCAKFGDLGMNGVKRRAHGTLFLQFVKLTAQRIVSDVQIFSLQV